MKRFVAVFGLLLASASFACPGDTLEVYSGEEIGGVCYMENGRVTNWLHITKVCLAETSGASIVFEKDREGDERLVGVCNGVFETHP